MLIAVAVTVGGLFFPSQLGVTPSVIDFALMALGVALGGGIGWIAAKHVAMTDMPQMVAIYNGMGGGAAGAIAAVELYPGGGGLALSSLSVVGGLIGAISFAGQHRRLPEAAGLDAPDGRSPTRCSSRRTSWSCCWPSSSA